MPLFEYICADCEKQFTFLSGVVADNEEPSCPRCHSLHLQKLISRISQGRSDDERMDAIAAKMDNQDWEDSTTLRRFAREMGKEISAESGEDVTDAMEQFIVEEASADSGNRLGNEQNHASSNCDDGKIY